MASSEQDPSEILAAAKVLQAHHDDAAFKPVVESLTRINNILSKAKFTEAAPVDPSLFEDRSEEDLYNGVEALKSVRDHNDLYEAFVGLQPVIDRYFDVNMIMAKDEAVKKNRLSQLAAVNDLTKRLGDLSKLVIK